MQTRQQPISLPEIPPSRKLPAPKAPVEPSVSVGGSFAALAHDARNMLSALDLYCDLLNEPGVLANEFLHYGNELKVVAASSRRLVEKMGALGLASPRAAKSSKKAFDASIRSTLPAPTSQSFPSRTTKNLQEMPELPIENLADELRSCENLLISLAGSSISLTFDIRECAMAVNLTGEGLIRILVNLVRNASEAMSGSGRIRISLRELPTETGTSRWAVLTVEDNGPGIPRDLLQTVFEPGFTTRGIAHEGTAPGPWPVVHRGLGLSITRSIVEAAGGHIHAAVRDPSGTCIQMEFPVCNSF